ncbi:MAG: flagellar basal body rod protein FlgB [candidate division Zixibacteria bacterium]|nr:flagellar basal body rod protein FlgB [candidate division Zixibacteria bacterium]
MPIKLSQYIFDKIGVPSYKKYLDMAAFRHKLLSGNLSNISTPGYKAKDINFTDEFNKANGATTQLTRVTTHQNHIPIGNHPSKPPKVNREGIVDGEMNSVDIDREITQMTQNEILFTVGAKLLQRKFEGLRTAITSK